jgi:hypothetical protein
MVDGPGPALIRSLGALGSNDEAGRSSSLAGGGAELVFSLDADALRPTRQRAVLWRYGLCGFVAAIRLLSCKFALSEWMMIAWLGQRLIWEISIQQRKPKDDVIWTGNGCS